MPADVDEFPADGTIADGRFGGSSADPGPAERVVVHPGPDSDVAVHLEFDADGAVRLEIDAGGLEHLPVPGGLDADAARELAAVLDSYAATVEE